MPAAAFTISLCLLLRSMCASDLFDLFTLSRLRCSGPIAVSHSCSASDKLGQYLEHHPKEARNIINKAVVASRAREAARKAREMVFRSAELHASDSSVSLTADLKSQNTGGSGSSLEAKNLSMTLASR